MPTIDHDNRIIQQPAELHITHQTDCATIDRQTLLIDNLRAQLAEKDKVIEGLRKYLSAAAHDFKGVHDRLQEDGGELFKAQDAFKYLKAEDEGCLGWVETDNGDWPILDELLSKIGDALNATPNTDGAK